MSTSPQRLLFASRGAGTRFENKLRCFPLSQHHIKTAAIRYTPAEFHENLCEQIKQAQNRVHLASLYIGPASDHTKSPREHQLLCALKEARCPSVHILLDHNRALRRVPTASSEQTITSAEACRRVLEHHGGTVGLVSVLPTWLQHVLPNPLNEIAGVFHLKIYIIDDQVVLSGANLSEEYFTNRVDRYLWVERGGNGLVECYQQVFEALQRFSVPYDAKNTNVEQASRRELMNEITRAFSSFDNDIEETNIESNVVAWAVPTFQAPWHFPRALPSDEEVLGRLIETAASFPGYCTVRLASAYLNPSVALERALSRCSSIHLLTAGRTSHGFKLKSSNEEKSGKRWIPGIFDTVARQTVQRWNRAKGVVANLWFYQRASWTFHAKGLWLHSEGNDARHCSPSRPEIHEKQVGSLVAVTHGSSNYGARSSIRDMESNVILILPQSASSGLRAEFTKEWNELCCHASQKEPPTRLPLHLRFVLPWIRTFF